jgi:phenylalanyl-tRNA synthetase beta chain
MKVHRDWLQTYFASPLPTTDELATLLTSRAFEIEETTGDMLDVKVLPDRAAYALSHRGIAYELAAMLALPLAKDPLRAPLVPFTKTEDLSVSTDPSYVLRHTGALVRGVTVGPSPEWLKSALESVGQRSINNVVDVLNYVMLDMGQPSGAFDVTGQGRVAIEVRRAQKGERITILTGEEYTLTDEMFVFSDVHTGVPLDIAGIKGGKVSGVTATTKDIFVTVGCYNPVMLRRTAQALKLFTDASLRYQNAPSPELTAYGMRDILALLTQVAGGTVVGVVDEYHSKKENQAVRVSYDAINGRLGTTYSHAEIDSVCERLGLQTEKSQEILSVTAPFERTDITIPEDVAEEVGRIMGYENLAPKLFESPVQAVDQREYRGVERIRDLLVAEGFMELSTQSFAESGDVRLANPLDVEHPYLRASLVPNMKKALTEATYTAPLVLKPKAKVKLFEIGSVFSAAGERRMLVTSEPVPSVEALIGATPQTGVAEYDLSVVDLAVLGEAYEPKRFELEMFRPFSHYPFVLRDIALWVPETESAPSVERVIVDSAGALLLRIDLFDTFAKNGRVSYAFRLVFQSMERTLTDVEVNTMMERVTHAVAEKGWEAR